MSKLKDSALFYAQNLGMPVFPLHGIVNGRCTCGFDCQSPGKHPILNGGPHKATQDYQVIIDWWNRWENANIGVPAGRVSGVVVLDIDVKGEGIKTFNDLVNKNGGFENTVIAKTGSGGFHILFSYEPGLSNKVRFVRGLDFKTDGGYFVVAPSKHISGNEYSWHNVNNKRDFKFEPTPQWLIDLLKDTSDADNKSNCNYMDISIGVEKGQRNNSLASLTGYLLNKGVSPEVTYNLVMSWNQFNSPPLKQIEVEKTFRSISRLHHKTRKG